jgi:hypothetical protein
MYIEGGEEKKKNKARSRSERPFVGQQKSIWKLPYFSVWSEKENKLNIASDYQGICTPYSAQPSTFSLY